MHHVKPPERELHLSGGKAKRIDIAEEKEDSDRWKEWLENLKPEDFGKYKM